MAGSQYRPDQFMVTSTYHFNCALNTGVPLLVARLLSVSETALNDKNSLFGWKDAFVEYYGLPQPTSLSRVRDILVQYPNAQDLQIILGPVLRLYLKNLIQNNTDVKKQVFSASGFGLLSVLKQFLKQDGKTNSIFYQTCKVTFDTVLASYRDFCEAGSKQKNLASVEEFFQKNSLESFVESLWNDHDARQYAEHITAPGMHLDVMETAIVYNQLGVSIESFYGMYENGVMTLAAPEIFAAPAAIATLKMVNRNGDHWETIADDVAAVVKHNASFHSGSLFNDELVNRYDPGISLFPDIGPLVKKHVRMSVDAIKPVETVAATPEKNPMKISYRFFTSSRYFNLFGKRKTGASHDAFNRAEVIEICRMYSGRFNKY